MSQKEESPEAWEREPALGENAQNSPETPTDPDAKVAPSPLPAEKPVDAEGNTPPVAEPAKTSLANSATSSSPGPVATEVVRPATPEPPSTPAAPGAMATGTTRRPAVTKPPTQAINAKHAERLAEVEAKKAERLAAIQAAAEVRAMKLAESQAAMAAKKAERLATMKAEADARAERMAAIKAANDAKKAAMFASSKPSDPPKMDSKPNPAAKPSSTPKAEAPVAAPAAISFVLGLAVQLDRNWDQVLQAALKNASASATQQLEGMLKIDSAVEQNLRRTVENEKRKLMRVLGMAVSTALSRLIEPSDLAFDVLTLDANGDRLAIPTKTLSANPMLRTRLQAQYRDLVGMIGANPSPIQHFGLKNNEIILAFGDSLAGNHFLSGTFKLVIDFGNAGASTVHQDFHIFAKNGKSMGSQLKISFMHDLLGGNYSGKLDADFPVERKKEG